MATLVAIALIDKIGRKPLLLIGSAGMASRLGAMAVLLRHRTGRRRLARARATRPARSRSSAANLYVVFFGVSWGPVVWVLLGEMFNNRIRAAALAVAAAAQWVANFIISTTFPALSAVGLGLAYGLYTVFALLSFFFVLRFVKETKGRQLEDME